MNTPLRRIYCDTVGRVDQTRVGVIAKGRRHFEVEANGLLMVF